MLTLLVKCQSWERHARLPLLAQPSCHLQACRPSCLIPCWWLWWSPDLIPLRHSMNLLSHCLGSMEGTPLSQRGSCNIVPLRCIVLSHDPDKSPTACVVLPTEPRQALTCLCSRIFLESVISRSTSKTQTMRLCGCCRLSDCSAWQQQASCRIPSSAACTNSLCDRRTPAVARQAIAMVQSSRQLSGSA